jgi:hypothetical protein
MIEKAGRISPNAAYAGAMQHAAEAPNMQRVAE